MTSLEPPQQKTEVLEGLTFSYFWSTWFRTIWSLLGYQNCRTEEFTPSVTGFGLSSPVANYNIFRNRFNFSVDDTSLGGLTINAGDTIDLKNLNKFVLTPLNDGYFTVSNTTTNLVLGHGVITNGIGYFPSIVILGAHTLNISGFYLIEETK